MRKLKVNDLKNIIRKEVRSLVMEAKDKKELKDSLDQQVDDYLTEYESDAKVKKNESVDFRSMTRSFLTSTSRNLFEAEEEKEGADDAEPEQKLKAEDINIEQFTSDVVRLIDNYDSLLEVRNTLARRAVNFLTKNYEQDVVNQFKITLEDQHDIVIGKSKSEEEDEKFQAPPAVRSGGTGGAA